MRGRLVLIALVVASCGRLGFDDRVAATSDGAHADGPTSPGDTVPVDAAPLLNGSGGVITSAGALADGPGMATGQHLVFATGTQTWWLFYIDDATTVLRTAYSTDLVGWRAGTSLVLPIALSYGENFSVGYKHIGGTDIVHVALAYTTNLEQHDHVRGVLGATSIAWGAEQTVGCKTTGGSGQQDGPAVAIGNDDRIYDFTSAWDDGTVCNGSDTAVGNVDATNAETPDTGGSAWTSVWDAPQYLVFSLGAVGAHWGAPMTGDRVLTVQDNGTADSQLSNLVWSIGSGSAFAGDQADAGSGSNVLTGDLATPVDPDDFGAVHVTDTDDLVVIRTAGGAFIASRFDGTAWSTIVPPPAQTSVAASGPFLASDGTSAWLFVIDDDAANTVRGIRFDGAGWGTWTAIESSPQSRTYLTGYPVVVGNAIALLWTQAGSGSGNAFDLVAELVPTSAL